MSGYANRGSLKPAAGKLCARCGRFDAGPVKFFIGAGRNSHAGDQCGGWVMVAGSGRLCCPGCVPGEIAAVAAARAGAR